MFDVNVVSQPDFSTFASAAAKSVNALNEASYKELLKQSVPKDKPVFRLEDPELFMNISTQKIAPGPGPEPGPKEASNIGTNNAR